MSNALLLNNSKFATIPALLNTVHNHMAWIVSYEVGSGTKQKEEKKSFCVHQESGIMFTYVSGDSFCDEFESKFQVTTSPHEFSRETIQSSMKRRKKVGIYYLLENSGSWLADFHTTD